MTAQWPEEPPPEMIAAFCETFGETGATARLRYAELKIALATQAIVAGLANDQDDDGDGGDGSAPMQRH